MHIEQLAGCLVFTSNDNVISVDVTSGSAQNVKIPSPQLPPNLTKGQLQVLNKQDRTINTLAVTRDAKTIAVSTENKQVLIFDSELNLVRNLIVNRTASKLAFTEHGGIVVADRTGDVFLYNLRDENSKPILLLGHLSMILDLVFSDCGKYVVTCDRDEKIRVSHFPNTYNIVSYCLGHGEFVNVVRMVRGVLVSASGDGTVRFWNYLKGQQLGVLDANQNRDAKIMEEFSVEMDKEKVDVIALPILDMQINILSDKNVLIAVALYKNKHIQLYNTSFENFNSTHLGNITVGASPYKFHLFDNLYICTNLQISVYSRTAKLNFVEIESFTLKSFHSKYHQMLTVEDNNPITVLYKRKFDNVQEYLQRKKARLGIK